MECYVILTITHGLKGFTCHMGQYSLYSLVRVQAVVFSLKTAFDKVSNVPRLSGKYFPRLRFILKAL